MTRSHRFPRIPPEFMRRRLQAWLTSWRKQWLRAGWSVLALGLTGGFYYYLAHVPVPVEVPKQVTVQGDHESLVIDSPHIGTNDEVLWHTVRRSEAVDAYFDDATFSSETLRLFHSLGVTPPEMQGPIAYITKSSGKDRNDTCRTSVRVRVADQSDKSTRLTVFQQQVDDAERHRYLGMNASHLVLAVELNTIGPTSGHNLVGSCAVVLKAGDWTQGLGSSVPVTIMASADSDFRFHFESLTASESPWGGTEDMFEPFTLSANGHPLTAEGLHVSSSPLSQAQHPVAPRLTIHAASSKSPIRIEHLKVGPGQLELVPSGKGWVTENGKKMTTDFKKRVMDNQILAGLLAAFNVWLLQWCWQQFPKKIRS